MTKNKNTVVSENCTPVALGVDWRSPDHESTEFKTKGSALNVAVKVFKHEECLHAEASQNEEEVATVLEGVFHIQAGDEKYDLTVGEGIIIPPDTNRLWRCTSNKGVLYRVLTQTQSQVEG